MAKNVSVPALRRLRQSQHVRDLVRGNWLSSQQMIQPLFVVEGIADRQEIPGLGDVYRDTPNTLLKQIEMDLEKGTNKFLLFAVPEQKALKEFDFSFASEQIAAVKKRFGSHVWLSVDVCLCSSTEHGHCGILDGPGTSVDHPSSVEALTQAAQEYAIAGADCLAPSDMMDGRIGSIRNALDHQGSSEALIMSYSAKFHSRFYGPFRVAADSAPRSALQDRATYQIDPARLDDALACSLRDAEEGADILMVKPGMPYLDVLANLSQRIPKPWAVYEVSGEFASRELLAREGLMSLPGAHIEAWTSFIRAGAKTIITYGARHAKDWIQQTL